MEWNDPDPACSLSFIAIEWNGPDPLELHFIFIPTF
jgi:hypothetical protein